MTRFCSCGMESREGDWVRPGKVHLVATTFSFVSSVQQAKHPNPHARRSLSLDGDDAHTKDVRQKESEERTHSQATRNCAAFESHRIHRDSCFVLKLNSAEGASQMTDDVLNVALCLLHVPVAAAGITSLCVQ